MFQIIYGILAKFVAVSPVDNWWESGGASGAVAVYQPVGAADLANSYIDLSGNGNDAAVGVAPTWDSVGGWTFDGSTQYLDSGVLAISSWSMIVRFSNFSTSTKRYMAGFFSGGATPSFRITPSDGAGAVVTYVNSANQLVGKADVAPSLGAGVLAISGNSGYRNGVVETSTLPADILAPVSSVLIGSVDGSLFFDGKIQAFAIYNNTLDAAQVLAVSNAMAAL